MLACVLVNQVAEQIEKSQHATEFEVTYHAEASDEVLKMAILILKNSGWEAKDNGNNSLVLTPFDPYDLDRLFILRGRDKLELEEARRPNGKIPQVWNIDELRSKLAG